MISCRVSLLLCVLVHSLAVFSASAFVTPTQRPGTQFSSLSPFPIGHKSLERQRQSVGKVQVQELFGLGGPEIAVILLVGAFIVTPDPLALMLPLSVLMFGRDIL